MKSELERLRVKMKRNSLVVRKLPARLRGRLVRIRKVRFRKKYVAIAGTSIVLFLLLGTLAYVKPSIPIPWLEVEATTLQTERINSTSEYPRFEFKKNHRIDFEYKDLTRYSKQIKTESHENYPDSYTIDSYPVSFPDSYATSENRFVYNSKYEDFEEGKNEIEVRRSVDLLFVELVSSEAITLTAEVDRIAPDFTVTDYKDKSYLLLEDFSVSSMTEPGARLFNGDVEIELESNTDDVGNLTAAAKITTDVIRGVEVKDPRINNIRIATITGENNLSLYAMDEFGNKSQPFEHTFQAFNDEGYVMKECGGIKFPYRNDMVLGIQDIGMDEATIQLLRRQSKQETINDVNKLNVLCNDTDISLSLFKSDNATMSCISCDAPLPSHIEISQVPLPLNEYKEFIKDDSQFYMTTISVLDERTIETVGGLTIEYLKTKTSGSIAFGGAPYYHRYYFFKVGNKDYKIGHFSVNAEYSDLSPYMNIIAEYMTLASE